VPYDDFDGVYLSTSSKMLARQPVLKLSSESFPATFNSEKYRVRNSAELIKNIIIFESTIIIIVYYLNFVKYLYLKTFNNVKNSRN